MYSMKQQPVRLTECVGGLNGEVVTSIEIGKRID